MKNVAPIDRRTTLGDRLGTIVRTALLFALPLASASASTCYGTVAQGRLEGGVPLPGEGKNYVAYSSAGVAMGRTYVHEKVREIVIDAYDGIKHDEHYHVDFLLPCRPLAEYEKK